MIQFSTVSKAGPDEKIKAINQLMKISGIEKISLLSVIQARFPSVESRDTTYAKFSGCILASDGDAFAKIFARALAEKMSDEDIEKSIAFYKSPLGEKIVRRQIVATYQMLSIPTDNQVEDLSDAETVKAEAFFNTEAGKLLEMKSILLLPSVLESFLEVQREIGKGCL
jgi:hypothetical protein